MSTACTQNMKAIGALWLGFRDQNIDFLVGCHSRALFASQPLTVVNSRGQSKITKFGELELRNHSETFAIDRTHEYCMYTKYEGHRSTLVGFPKPKH